VVGAVDQVAQTVAPAAAPVVRTVDRVVQTAAPAAAPVVTTVTSDVSAASGAVGATVVSTASGVRPYGPSTAPAAASTVPPVQTPLRTPANGSAGASRSSSAPVPVPSVRGGSAAPVGAQRVASRHAPLAGNWSAAVRDMSGIPALTASVSPVAPAPLSRSAERRRNSVPSSPSPISVPPLAGSAGDGGVAAAGGVGGGGLLFGVAILLAFAVVAVPGLLVGLRGPARSPASVALVLRLERPG
jgi:hypothetical protein